MNASSVYFDSVIRQQNTQGISIISPAPRDAWEDLVKSDPQTLTCQTSAWTDCLCSSGGYQDASRLYHLPDGRRLLLPLVRQRGWPAFLATQASFPNSWGIGGPLVSDQLTANDVTLIMADLAAQPVLRTIIRPNPLLGDVWATAHMPRVMAEPRRAHVLDLEGGFDRVWEKRFNHRTRTKVRQAERAGLTIECDTSGRLASVFYELFLQSVDRWAQKQHEPRYLAHWRAQRRDPLEKIQAIAQGQGNACRIWAAWLDGQPVAAIMVLLGKNAHCTRGAMNKCLTSQTRANELLHRLAIEEACQAGCRYYHLGETGQSRSLAQYKEGLGAVPYAYAEYRVEWLPVTRVDRLLRRGVKRLIGFKDV